MMDFVLEAWVSAIIEFKARIVDARRGHEPWHPGEKLKLLFAGYNGTRNTGSDVRVEEILRQLRHILGADQVDLSVMTQTFARSAGYFQDTRQVHVAADFPALSVKRSRPGITAWWPVKAPCSRANSPMRLPP